MIRKFLLIAGDYYYPCAGTGDWRGFYNSYEEAFEKVMKNEGGCYETSVLIDGNRYDWYKIIDLEKELLKYENHKNGE